MVAAQIEACASHEMLTMLGNKWTILTMGYLFAHRVPVRFSALRKALPGISQRMLTATLRTLEVSANFRAPFVIERRVA